MYGEFLNILIIILYYSKINYFNYILFIINYFKIINIFFLMIKYGDGDWGLGIRPNPQSPFNKNLI